MVRSIVAFAFFGAALGACANGADSDVPAPGQAAVASPGVATSPDSALAAATSPTASVSAGGTEPAGAERAASTPCVCASGPLVEMLLASVRQRIPEIEKVDIAQVRSQQWGHKHVILTRSPASDSVWKKRAYIAVHAVDRNFGAIRTLGVFMANAEDEPTIQRVAADSVVVMMVPEKGNPDRHARQAFFWREADE